MKYKETPVQNLTFIALMAGINVVLCTLFRFVPFSTIFLILVLPFLSSLVIIYCKWKYTIIYTFVTIALTLLISLENSLFYIITPMLSGLTFGFCFKKKIHSSFAILFATLMTLALYYITMPIIEFVLGVSIINSFQIILSLSAYEAKIFFPVFVIFTSICQTIISYIIINSDLKKYIEYEEPQTPYNVLSLITLAFSLISIGLLFVYLPLSLSIGLISLFLSYYPLKRIIINHKYWLLVVIILLFIISFALLYQLVAEPKGIGFIALISLYISLFSLTLWKIPNN